MSTGNHIIPVFVPHVGCPHQCVFCNQNNITGTVGCPTADDVRAAVQYALDIGNTAPRCLAFYGGSFTAIPLSEQLELLQAGKEFIDSGTLECLRVSTRPDAIDEDRLAVLKRYGVRTIEIGAQSMDDTVLRSAGRGHTAADVVRAAGFIQQAGFELVLQMMTGLPGDSKAKAITTANQIAALHPAAVRIYPTVVVKDTPLYRLWETGRYSEHTVEEAVDWCAELLPIFEQAGIPVIRLGLNPTDELSGGLAVAGAYHPALGELVKSRVIRNRISDYLRSNTLCAEGNTELNIYVTPSMLSQTIGQKACNSSFFKSEFGYSAVKVIGNPQISKSEFIIKETKH